MDNDQDKILIDWLQQAFDNSTDEDKQTIDLAGKSLDNALKELLDAVSLDERYFI